MVVVLVLVNRCAHVRAVQARRDARNGNLIAAENLNLGNLPPKALNASGATIRPARVSRWHGERTRGRVWVRLGERAGPLGVRKVPPRSADFGSYQHLAA